MHWQEESQSCEGGEDQYIAERVRISVDALCDPMAQYAHAVGNAEMTMTIEKTHGILRSCLRAITFLNIYNKSVLVSSAKTYFSVSFSVTTRSITRSTASAAYALPSATPF